MTGRAQGVCADVPLSSFVKVPFYEFPAREFRCLIRPQDKVLQGTPLLQHKGNPSVVIVSPVSGCVTRLMRGLRRVPEYVEIAPDECQQARVFPSLSGGCVSDVPREEIAARMLEGGLWPLIRQRPFGSIADPSICPGALFVRAMDTSPLAPDINIILQGCREEVVLGLSLVARLAGAPVYVCHGPEVDLGFSCGVTGVERVMFSGPHPAGNAGTHIHCLFPLSKGRRVWTMDIQDVIAVARFFRDGKADFSRVVAVAGEGVGADRRRHVRVLTGTLLENLTGPVAARARIIAGNPLWGVLRQADDGLGFSTTQVTVLPGAGTRRFLGWLAPVSRTPSLGRMFFPGGCRGKERFIDNDLNGSPRAIVLNDVYDDLVALDVLTFFLIKAILAGEIEEMERLGILECAPEDFALAAFACPSKTDIPALIACGLELMEKEGV